MARLKSGDEDDVGGASQNKTTTQVARLREDDDVDGACYVRRRRIPKILQVFEQIEFLRERKTLPLNESHSKSVKGFTSSKSVL